MSQRAAILPYDPTLSNPDKAILRIGTRGSPLALAQAREVCARLVQYHSALNERGALAIIPITTSGDYIADQSLAEFGGKGLFTKEIEDALELGRIDLAVHSMKDVPTALPPLFEISAVLPRENPYDVLILACDDESLYHLEKQEKPPSALSFLPEGSVVGTCSPRRQAQLLHKRPDLKVVPMRGNVGTRLQKLHNGRIAATLLAAAGLNRLNVNPEHSIPLSVDDMVPAAGQGAIGVEVRAKDQATKKWLVAIDDSNSSTAIRAERAFLKVLEGSCKTPLAALATLDTLKRRIIITGLAASPNGSWCFRQSLDGPLDQAITIGTSLGKTMLDLLGPDRVKELREA